MFDSVINKNPCGAEVGNKCNMLVMCIGWRLLSVVLRMEKHGFSEYQNLFIRVRDIREV